MKNNLFYIILLCLTLQTISSCKKSNTNPVNTNPVACFSTNKDSYNFGDVVLITNCSQNASSYTWSVKASGSSTIFTQDGDLTTFAIPNDGTIPAGTYIVTLKAFGIDANGNSTYNETSKVFTITTVINPTIGTPNLGTYTKMYINKIEILGFPSIKPNGHAWDYGQVGSSTDYEPDIYIRIYRQTSSTSVTDFYNNYSDLILNRTGSATWNYISNPSLINIPINQGFKLNIKLCDDDFSSSFETISQILDIDLCASANYGKPTLTFTQGDFTVRFTLQWQ